MSGISLYKIKEIPKRVKQAFSSMGKEIKHMRGSNVWIFIMYGLLFDMSNNLWRPFAVRFLERLGGTEFHISLLSALPGLVAALVLLPGAVLFRKFTNKKRATAMFILISRASLLLIAFIPVFPARLQPLLFVIFVAIMNCPDSLSQTSLQSFLGTVFAGNQRGEAIALRTKFGQALIPVVTISAGLAITFIPNSDEGRMVLYQIFFVVAFLIGLLEVFVFNRLKVPEYLQTTEEVKQPKVKVLEIVKNKKFRAFFIPAICFAFTWQAGWPLVSIHQVMTLEATEMWFAIFALMSGIASLASGKFWQRILQKRGNHVTFVISAALIALNMFIFPLTSSVQMMAIVTLLTGFSAIGITTTFLNGVLEATPDENRLMYLAFYNTAMNISLFIAPFFAILLLNTFGNRNAMFIVGILRVVAVGFIFITHKLSKISSIRSKSPVE